MEPASQGGVADQVLRKVSVPDIVETALGTFRFRDGLPDAATWFDQTWRPGEIEPEDGRPS